MSPTTRGSSGVRFVDRRRRLDRWLYPYRDGSARRPWTAVLPQIAMIGCALLAYFAVRGLTKGAEDVAIEHARDLLVLEESLRLDWEAGAQRWALAQPGVVDFFNSVYVWGYWPPLLAALAYFWVADRRQYTILRDALFISGAVGLVIFASYPVAPPRFLPGFVDTIAESRRGMFIAQPPGFVNKYAALPSFHTGWLALVGAALYPHLPRRIAVVAFMPIAFMSASVVVTGNHFVIDIVAGVAFSLGGLAFVRRIHQPLHARATRLVLDHGAVHATAARRRDVA